MRYLWDLGTEISTSAKEWENSAVPASLAAWRDGENPSEILDAMNQNICCLTIPTFTTWVNPEWIQHQALSFATWGSSIWLQS